ncbi:MAG: Linoleoyl-CoA desaturase, partial [uncultured Rubrobacteraceae bacterium]
LSATVASLAVRRRPPRSVRPVHGLGLRAQPQGHAHPGEGQRDGLFAPAGAYQPQRPRPPGHRLLVRGPQLPDRAPPVPEAPPEQAQGGAADHQGLLPGPRDPLPRDERAPVLPRDTGAPARGRRPPPQDAV